MKRKRRPKQRTKSEPRGVEVLTVGWMLMVVTTLACEVGFVVSRMLADSGGPLMLLSGLLLFAALVIGLIALATMPVVVRSRRAAPPTGIVVFAAVISGAPLAMALIEVLNR